MTDLRKWLLSFKASKDQSLPNLWPCFFWGLSLFPNISSYTLTHILHYSHILHFFHTLHLTCGWNLWHKCGRNLWCSPGIASETYWWITDAISKVFHHTGKWLHKEVSIVLHKVLQTGALQLNIMQVIGHHSWFYYAIGKATYLCHGFQPTLNQIHNNAADAVAIKNV